MQHGLNTDSSRSTTYATNGKKKDKQTPGFQSIQAEDTPASRHHTRVTTGLQTRWKHAPSENHGVHTKSRADSLFGGEMGDREQLAEDVYVHACEGSASAATKNKELVGAAGGAQSVKCPTLDFGSGHDLAVHGLDPHVQALCCQCGACFGSSVSLSLSAPRALSLKNQTLKKKKSAKCM